MGKLILVFTLLFSFQLQANKIENFEFFFQNDLQEIDKLIGLITLKDHKLFSLLEPQQRFSTIASDPKEKISSEFEISPFFKEATKFWFKTYSLYSTQSALIHDREKLSIVYTIVDYTDLHSSNLSARIKQAIQNQFTENKILEIRQALTKLSKGKSISSELNTLIHEAINKSDHSLPDDENNQSDFYLSLAENIRAQTGQRNNIKQGLINYYSYAPVIDSYIEQFGLPSEVLALAFLESSFNTNALSRVGATGVWQFMSFIGRHFMIIDDHQDHRLNPLISTASALFLLKENRQILRRWDLAIVAYNSGTRHIINARRSLDMPRMTLEDYLTKYNHAHIGFASKNFYPSFLALVHMLAYKDQFFNIESLESKAAKKSINSQNLKAYVTICPINMNWFFSALEDSSPKIRDLNQHILNPDREYPKGTIVYSDVDLTSARYVGVSVQQVSRTFPNKWKKFSQNHSCSTR